MKIALAIAIAVLVAIAALAVSTEAAGPPTVTTGTGSGGLSCSPKVPSHATLNGTVNPNGQDTTYYFQYGSDATYGSQTETQDAGGGTADVAVSADLSNVGPAPIHFRLVATGGGTTVYGDDHIAQILIPPCPAPPSPQFQARVTVALGCTSAPPTATARVTITPVMSDVELGATASIGYGPGAGASLQPPHESSGVRVPWSSASTAPVTVTIPIGTVPSRNQDYSLIVRSDGAGSLVSPISDVAFIAPSCVAHTPGKTSTTNVPWSLVGLSRRHHTATISFQPPACATKAPAHVTVTPLRHHRVRIAVTMRVWVPPVTCATLKVKRQLRTIHLPRGTTAAQLVHAR